MTNNDTLTLFIEKSDVNKLGVRIENGEKNSITNYKLSLLMNCQCDSIQGRADIALLVPSTFVLALLPILGPDGFSP